MSGPPSGEGKGGGVPSDPPSAAVAALPPLPLISTSFLPSMPPPPGILKNPVSPRPSVPHSVSTGSTEEQIPASISLDSVFDLVNSHSDSSCNSGSAVERSSPEDPTASAVDAEGAEKSAARIRFQQQQALVRSRGSREAAALRRRRTASGSKTEDHIMRSRTGGLLYTKGRPPWFNHRGEQLKEPMLIGICGGSASGKTTVAHEIYKTLDLPWVTHVSMDSFYKVLTEEQHKQAALNEYNFDHPDAFDFELLLETLKKLRDGKYVQVPVYNFTTHSREKNYKTMYGADIIIFEGILAFYNKNILDLMDLRIFVDTPSDERLIRRIKRDTTERGRDQDSVFEQYFKHVKPAFDSFIAPTLKSADIIVPRGGENRVAVDMVVQHVRRELEKRGYNGTVLGKCQSRLHLAQINGNGNGHAVPETLFLVPETNQIRGLHTFIRNKKTSRDEFIFYSERLMRLLIEYALSHLPFDDVRVETPQGTEYTGKRNACRGNLIGVSILRAGETMENALRAVIKDCKMGKILIQTNPETKDPELHYRRLPADIHEKHKNYRVLLMDATVATGAAAIMAIRVLLDHDVLEENIMLLSLLMASTGVQSVAYAFPKVKLITTAVDDELNSSFHILPGIGNFGDRYYGTQLDISFSDEDDSDMDNSEESNSDE